MLGRVEVLSITQSRFCLLVLTTRIFYPTLIAFELTVANSFCISAHKHKLSNSFSTYKLFTIIFSQLFLVWLTRKVTIDFGTKSLMFFFTTLKYDVISLFIISVSVCSRSLGFSGTLMTAGTQGSLYRGRLSLSVYDV